MKTVKEIKQMIVDLLTNKEKKTKLVFHSKDKGIRLSTWDDKMETDQDDGKIDVNIIECFALNYEKGLEIAFYINQKEYLLQAVCLISKKNVYDFVNGQIGVSDLVESFAIKNVAKLQIGKENKYYKKSDSDENVLIEVSAEEKAEIVNYYNTWMITIGRHEVFDYYGNQIFSDMGITCERSEGVIYSVDTDVCSPRRSAFSAKELEKHGIIMKSKKKIPKEIVFSADEMVFIRHQIELALNRNSCFYVPYLNRIEKASYRKIRKEGFFRMWGCVSFLSKDDHGLKVQGLSMIVEYELKDEKKRVLNFRAYPSFYGSVKKKVHYHSSITGGNLRVYHHIARSPVMFFQKPEKNDRLNYSIYESSKVIGRPLYLSDVLFFNDKGITGVENIEKILKSGRAGLFDGISSLTFNHNRRKKICKQSDYLLGVSGAQELFLEKSLAATRGLLLFKIGLDMDYHTLEGLWDTLDVGKEIYLPRIPIEALLYISELLDISRLDIDSFVGVARCLLANPVFTNGSRFWQKVVKILELLPYSERLKFLVNISMRYSSIMINDTIMELEGIVREKDKLKECVKKLGKMKSDGLYWHSSDIEYIKLLIQNVENGNIQSLIKDENRLQSAIFFRNFNALKIRAHIYNPHTPVRVFNECELIKRPLDTELFSDYLVSAEVLLRFGVWSKVPIFFDLKKMRKMHDDTATIASDLLTEHAKEKFLSLHEKYSSIYAFEDDNYFIKVPKGPADLHREGRDLCHCVGTYVEGYANKNFVILFVRKKSAPNKSFATIEVCNGKIVQCKGFQNMKIDDPSFLEFIKHFKEDVLSNLK